MRFCRRLFASLVVLIFVFSGVASPYSMTLLMQCIASVVLLSFLKPYCVDCRYLSSLSDILLCSSAAISLYIVFSSDIGL